MADVNRADRPGTQRRDADLARAAAEDVREQAEDVREQAEDVQAATGDVREAAEDVREAAEDVREQAEDVHEDAEEFLIEDRPERSEERPFGLPGRPLRRSSPFYIGFVGALGALVAWYVTKAIVGASQVIILVVVSMFLAVGLNPIVERLMRTGLSRRTAVLVVTFGVLAVFVGFMAAVLPPLVTQTTELVSNLPDIVDKLGENRQLERLNEEYGVLDRLGEVVGSGTAASTVFGGVLGVGRFVLGGLFSALTVLILTLYFLGSLPKIKRHAYQLVPRSRRERVRLLSDEVLLRIGGYVDGQLTIAALAGLSTFLVLEILGVPYAITLALVVAFFGLIPMVGASIGGFIVCVVAFVDSMWHGIIAFVFFVLYQQVENYVIYPRVMRRSVNVPPAVTLIAALVGGTMLGVVGALIAIPTAAAVLLIAREVVMPRQDRV